MEVWREAKRFLEEFREPPAKFGWELDPEKTPLIEFGRYARQNRAARDEGEVERFTFLGFAHDCGINSRGNFTVWRRTARMHGPWRVVGEWRLIKGCQSSTSRLLPILRSAG